MREDLNKRAPRVMAVLRPLQGGDRQLPGRPGRGAGGGQQSRRRRAWARAQVPFSKVLYIEQDDFREEPPKKYFRLAPGREVRLRYGYFITCTERREGREDRRGRRGALHLRSGDPRRQHAGRPQGEVHDPLGLGRARRRGRGAALRQPLHQGESRRRRAKARISRSI